jgi:amino acid adenylation domain-containing protein
MADLARATDHLSEKKRQLLELLLAERRGQRAERAAGAATPPATIPRRAQVSPAPVSFAQQRLWFIDQLTPGTPIFNIPAAVRIHGELDRAIFERALAEVVRRHETLRTRFAAEEGQPRQVIDPVAALEVPLLDLSDLPPERQMERVKELITTDCQRSFDLARCPLVRVTLLHLGPADHVLIVMMHHIIGDVWSVRVLMKELAHLCSAFMRRQPSPLPVLPVQYADYAVWHRDWLRGENYERELGYWKERLAGMPPELRLPFDRPRPPLQSQWGAKYFFHLRAGLPEALRALGRRAGASLFMVLLAAWKALLSRYTGQRDIVLGAPVANRNRSELEPLIGFFVNSVVLRTELSGDPTFGELLGRVRETVLGAFSHQDIPFERLVEVLQPERDLSRNPLYQSDFILQNAPRGAYEVPGLSFETLPVETGTAQIDMTLDLWEEDGGVGGWLEYDVDLFDRTTAGRMVRHLVALFEEVAADPGRRLSQLAGLLPEERHQLLREWNDTARDYALEGTFPGLFLEHAARCPDAVAAACEEAAVSYGALAERSRALAARLAGHGVGVDGVVALLAPRGLSLLAAITGALTAGAAYLPLDPDHPPRRHAQVLQASGAPLVLVARELAAVFAAALEELPVPRRPRVLVLEEALAVPPPGDALCPARPESLAYVLFTSGSTGRPKGVMIHHRGLLNHLWANLEALAMGPRDVLAQTANACFDISVWQFLAPLLAGGRVEIFPDELTRDPVKLLAAVEERSVTVFETVPSLLRVALDGAPGEEPPALTALSVLLPTGEALPPALARRWFERYPGVPLVNAYGPSECSDDVTLEPLREAPAEGAVTLGRPVGNLGVVVVDRDLRPVPVGVAGELAVAGVGVGRGYLADPVRTAVAFVPRPGGAPGERLYRSGDLTRCRADGRLEFLGRIDFQVKIRGFRIELGEVETALARHHAVAEAVAVAHTDDRGETLLVAYLVPAGEAPSLPELRDHLRSRLPEYMVPHAFVYLEDMPRSASGKVDRRRLPKPDGGAREETAFVAPRTPTEEVLAGLWGEVLALDRVGVEHNLFQLGAHSLLLTQVVSRVRKAFGVEPPLRSFFEDPTVAGMARTLDALAGRAGGPEVPPIVRVPREGHLPLSFTQERMWFLHQLEPELTAYNVPGAVVMDGRLCLASLEQSFGVILLRHEVFRTNYRAVGGRPSQVIHSPAPCRLPVVDLTGLPEDEREGRAFRLARADARRPFDLAHGPVLRPLLVRVRPHRHVLGITTHHIAYDMWAREIFILELGSAYQAFFDGAPLPLPEPEVQFVDYAAWQRNWMSGAVLEAELDHWQERLAGIPPYLDLATDRPRPPVQSYRGARQYLKLSRELAARVQALSRRQGVTPFITILAAFKALLSRYSGQTGIAVGSPIANRNRVEVEKLIGFLSNTLVLYTRLDGDPSFEELLRRVRDTSLDAYAHQEVPFEFLVQRLLPERDMSRSPLFQVMLNYMLFYWSPTVDLPELTLSIERLHGGGAQFDLNLDLWETGDGIYGVVEYCTDLYFHATITRLIGHFEALLEGAVAEPGRRLSELPLLSPAERHQLVVEARDTARSYRLELTFGELFAEQVTAAPDRIAAAAEGFWLSYGELDRRTAAAAAELRGRGVEPDQVVALLAERGLPLLATIVAVLRAGGAYLPLDPAHPPERHRQILERGRPRWVVAEGHRLERLREAAEGLPVPPRLCALEDLPWGGDAPAPPVPRWPERLSYVIFTSGSTGAPKGVMIPEGGLLNHLWANLEALEMGPQDTLAQTANPCFDISVWQFLAPLLVGGRVQIFPDAVTENPPRLLRQVVREQVTVFETVPSLLALMLDDTRGELPLPALRRLLPTGEALPPELARRWLSAYPAIPLVNAYGPSECSDDVTLHTLASPLPPEATAAPIGRPVANLTVRLLDRARLPVPWGMAGEIAVGGVGVGRGYLHDPARTAAVFLPDPWAVEPGTRLYASGDLGRQGSDGVLEFLGRIDHQVKIRGFRIELPEIEAVLVRHLAVREAVVVVREDRPGEPRLAAYLVAAEGADLEPAEVKGFLRERLPAYMVPAALVVLPALPLTANGKVDRRALPAPEGPAEAAFVAPRDAEEERVAAIFAEVLGIPRVSVEDDFFDLGGHSLLAVQVLSRIRDAFGVEPPLRLLFETSTAAGMAEAVRAVRWALAGPGEAEPAGVAAGAHEEGVI